MQGRRWVISLVVVGTIALCTYLGYMAFILGAPLKEDYTNRESFESVAWKRDPLIEDSDYPPRLRMVDDLLDQDVLNGKSRAEVIEVLGEPDPPRTSNWDMWYYLGPERGLIRIDSEWLVLRFDESGTVTEAEIYRD